MSVTRRGNHIVGTKSEDDNTRISHRGFSQLTLGSAFALRAAAVVPVASVAAGTTVGAQTAAPHAEEGESVGAELAYKAGVIGLGIIATVLLCIAVFSF